MGRIWELLRKAKRHDKMYYLKKLIIILISPKCRPVTPALGRCRQQEEQEFQVILGNTES